MKGHNVKRSNEFTLTFDVKVLNKLLTEENSCVEARETTHHLALHPFHLGNLNKSIKDILSKGLGKYSKELGGILFGYDNIKLLSDLGKTFDDSCFIHIDIEAKFYIFKPIIGQILNGVVNKRSKNHVGCLVHKVFNISLPRPDNNSDWLGNYIDIGAEILIEITNTKYNGWMPYIRGKINSIVSTFESTGTPSNKKIKFEEYGEESIVNEENPKRRKHKLSFSHDLEESPKKKKIKSEKAEDTPKKRKRSGSFSKEVAEEAPPKRRKKNSLEAVQPKVENENGEFDEIFLKEESPKKRKKSKSFSDTINEEETCKELLTPVQKSKKKKEKIHN